MKCENLFCQHPVLFGIGLLIVFILVIILLFEPFATKDPKRGKGGGSHDRPWGSDFPPPFVDVGVFVPQRGDSDPIDRRTERETRAPFIQPRTSGDVDRLEQVWRPPASDPRYAGAPRVTPAREIPAPQEKPIEVPNWPVRAPRNK